MTSSMESHAQQISAVFCEEAAGHSNLTTNFRSGVEKKSLYPKPARSDNAIKCIDP